MMDEKWLNRYYILREEAYEIAANTGGDPEVWARLYGLDWKKLENGEDDATIEDSE